MKKIKITKGRIGIVFRKGEFKKVLKSGEYWLSYWDELKEYDLGEGFVPYTNINLVLENKELMKELQLVEVKEGEVVLKYEDGYFSRVLTIGRYLYWKGLKNYKFEKIDSTQVNEVTGVSDVLLSSTILAPYIRTFKVEAYEQGVLLIDGKDVEVVGAGVYNYWKNNTVISLAKADMRNQQLEVLGQEILTKDKANVRINVDAQYKVVDVYKALYENKLYAKQLYTVLQLVLREYIGSMTLDELLEKKGTMSAELLQIAQEKVTSLGVKLNQIGLRDVILPGDVKEIMNQVLVAQKKAQANTIMRREETASTRSLLNTAKLMEDNEMLFKLKEMEYVEKIADKINNITVSGGGQVVDQLKDIFVKR